MVCLLGAFGFLIQDVAWLSCFLWKPDFFSPACIFVVTTLFSCSNHILGLICKYTSSIELMIEKYFYDLVDVWLMSRKDCASIKVVWWVNRTLSKPSQSLLKRHIRDKALICLGMRFSDWVIGLYWRLGKVTLSSVWCSFVMKGSQCLHSLFCILTLYHAGIWNLPGLSGVPFVEKQVL